MRLPLLILGTDLKRHGRRAGLLQQRCYIFQQRDDAADGSDFRCHELLARLLQVHEGRIVLFLGQPVSSRRPLHCLVLGRGGEPVGSIAS
jgi:hypothetical protein